jgi:hypothetical protein
MSVSSIGGISASATGGGLSISGKTVTDEMSQNNVWQINSTYDYSIGGLLLSAGFSTFGRVKIGSDYFSMSTG